jgi:uncharacterized membrane protein
MRSVDTLKLDWRRHGPASWGSSLSSAIGNWLLTVVSIPLVLDHDIDFVTAMITSVRAVVANPAPMLGWRFTVGVLLALASLPFFVGFVFVLPILGHATWHLYCKVVDPVPG